MECLDDREKRLTALAELQKRMPFIPRAALVLGSGMEEVAEAVMEVAAIVEYRNLPGMPLPTVEWHRGRYLFGSIGGVPSVILQGRLHYYEGFTASEAVMPLRLARMAGAGTVVLTNAAGAIDPALAPGQLMLISDQLLWGVPSPLRGGNDDDLGPRFPDMTDLYDPELRRLFQLAAQAAGIPLREGVFVQTPGPQFETPAEIRAFAAMGAAAVAMSTGIEAVAARHAGMRVAGISCLSNRAAGLSGGPQTAEEVLACVKHCTGALQHLLTAVFPLLNHG